VGPDGSRELVRDQGLELDRSGAECRARQGEAGAS
jgi:hypothetical protein